MANFDDVQWMRKAIELAKRGNATQGANSIGCVIVRDGVEIARGFNEVGIRHDPTAHAEIVAMRRAGKRAQCPELRGAVLYTTLQPCGMCTMASIWAKIGRIVFGRCPGQPGDRSASMDLEAYRLNCSSFGTIARGGT